jgi:MFS family permease
LIIGLIGAMISALAFGFSFNFAFAIIARALNGVLNGILVCHTPSDIFQGNIGVVKTYFGEITDSTNQSRAIGYIGLYVPIFDIIL